MMLGGASEVSVRDHLVSMNIPTSRAIELANKIRASLDKKLIEYPELKLSGND
jgi:hypothetical protein